MTDRIAMTLPQAVAYLEADPSRVLEFFDPGRVGPSICETCPTAQALEALTGLDVVVAYGHARLDSGAERVELPPSLGSMIKSYTRDPDRRNEQARAARAFGGINESK